MDYLTEMKIHIRLLGKICLLTNVHSLTMKVYGNGIWMCKTRVRSDGCTGRSKIVNIFYTYKAA